MKRVSVMLRPVGRPGAYGAGKAPEGADLSHFQASLAKGNRHTPRYPVAERCRRKNGGIAPLYLFATVLLRASDLGLQRHAAKRVCYLSSTSTAWPASHRGAQ